MNAIFWQLANDKPQDMTIKKLTHDNITRLCEMFPGCVSDARGETAR